MGTSVGQIEATYGHLLPDAHDRARAGLDAFGAMSLADGHDWARVADQHSPVPESESPVLRGFLAIGAPRFELGTSSPPD